MSASEIRKHLNLFESVEQPTPSDREAMLKKDGMRLREITDPTMDECVVAMKQNVKAMWYVPLDLRNRLEPRLPYKAKYCSRKDLPPGAIYDTRQTGDMIAWIWLGDLESPSPDIQLGAIGRSSKLDESDQKLTRLIRHVYQQNPKKLAAMLREAIGDTQKKNR